MQKILSPFISCCGRLPVTGHVWAPFALAPALSGTRVIFAVAASVGLPAALARQLWSCALGCWMTRILMTLPKMVFGVHHARSDALLEHHPTGSSKFHRTPGLLGFGNDVRVFSELHRNACRDMKSRQSRGKA